MYRQPEMCRKRSAFRKKIRQDYIDSLLKKRRQEYQQQQSRQYSSPCKGSSHGKDNGNRDHIKELSEFKILDSIVKSQRRDYGNGVCYPFVSAQIPALQLDSREGEGEPRTIKLREFSSYEHFVEYMDNMMGLLPGAIYSLVSLFNNNPQLTPQFLKYLFTQPQSNSSSRLPALLQKFSECSVPQFLNYLHILQLLLLNLLQSSQPRVELARLTAQQVTHRIFSMYQHNKMMRLEILKAFFDFLVTLGDDIRVIRNVEVVIMVDWVREVFGVYFDQEGDHRDGKADDLYDSVIVVCNTVVSLGSHSAAGQNEGSSIKQLDQAYQTQLLKQLFITQLLKYPRTIHNMLLLAMSPTTHSQLQHILRFLINLTYTLSTPQTLILFLDSLVILLQTVLAQRTALGRLSMVNILLLRLINNVAVNDGFSAQVLWTHQVVAKAVEGFGFWLLAGLGVLEADKGGDRDKSNGKKRDNGDEQPQMHVFSQFLSFITTYIILLSNNEPPETLSHSFTEYLQQLIQTKHIHLILLQSLTLPYIATGQPETIIKCLEALLVLSNCRGNRGNGVRASLLGYRPLIQSLMGKVQDQQVAVLCEELMEVVKMEVEQVEGRRKMDEETRKEQQMYDEYCRTASQERQQGSQQNQNQ